MDVNLLKTIAKEFNERQAHHKLTSPVHFEFEDLMNTDNIIINANGNSKLTNIFLDNFFPQNDQLEYHHFTTFEVLKSILTNNSIWLTSVAKRFNEQEFKPFYKAHKMDGYEKKTSSKTEPLVKELVDNAFYLSLTHKNINEDTENHLWQSFSNNQGVRIVFEFSDVKTHLRKVYYPLSKKAREISLLTDFIKVAENHNRYLIFEGLATVGFFYLPSIFECEQEYRILVKRDVGQHYNFKFGHHLSNGFEYMELPLFDNPLIKIKIKGIILQNQANEGEVLKVLNSDPMFSGIKLEIKI